MRGSVKFTFVWLKIPFATLALCAVAFLPPAAATEERRPPVRHDAKLLRRALEAAVGGEFVFVRDELVRRSAYYGGGAYWLAHVRPKRAGSFSLKYTYRYEDPFNKEDPLYTHVAHTITINVGPRGCYRPPQHLNAFSWPCLGDTVILPVVLDAYKRTYTEHKFEFAVLSVSKGGEPAGPNDWQRVELRRQEAGLGKDEIANPLAEHLKYVGSTSHVSPHRAAGFTVEYYATFEAVRPGRFNLLLGRVSAPVLSKLTPQQAGGIPVIVVARGTPVTWLAARESVHGYTERFGSHSGNEYHTTPVILQPGERLTVRYGGFTRGGRDGERGRGAAERQKPPPPDITRLPFYVNPDEGFNEWLVNHLPAR